VKWGKFHGAGADYAEMRDQKTYKIIGAALEACPPSASPSGEAGGSITLVLQGRRVKNLGIEEFQI